MRHHPLLHRHTDHRRASRLQNGIYVGRASDGVVTGFIPKIREHTTSEPGPDGQQLGPGPDRTNLEGLGVSEDRAILYGNEVGLHSVVRFIRNK